jgi:hypothetical protein
MKRLTTVVLACAALGGCASPEATRQRGGGPGGDSGNRPPQVKMHEGSRQYWGTPVLIPGEGTPLAPSEQARRLSLTSTGATEGASTPPQTPSPAGGRGQ